MFIYSLGHHRGVPCSPRITAMIASNVVVYETETSTASAAGCWGAGAAMKIPVAGYLRDALFCPLGDALVSPLHCSLVWITDFF